MGAMLAVSLVLLEASLRVFGAFLPGTYRVGSLIEPDRDLGWRHVRSDSYSSRFPEWNVRVELNAEGRRGSLAGTTKPGVARIEMLGDSIVEGAQVEYAETVSVRLAEILGASRVVVLDDGVSGYGTDQEVLEFERSASHPDIAVLVFTLGNDVWNNYEPFESQRPTTVKPFFKLQADGSLALEPAARLPLWDEMRLVLARSAALSMLKSAFAPDRPAPDFRRQQLAVLEPPSGAWEAAWTTTEEILARFASDARAAGTYPLLVIAPEGCQVHDDLCGEARELSGSRVAQDRLLAFADRIGLPTVDLLPIFRTEAARGARLHFRRDLHWTATGHDLAGSTIARALAPILDHSR